MTPEALERHYSPSRYARDVEATLARQAEEGTALVARHRPHRLGYGDDPEACLDLFLPRQAGPWSLMVFIHGGYWQELDHTATNFLAERYLARGMAFASLGYGLAPRVSIEAMIAQCRDGLEAATARVAEQGGVERLVPLLIVLMLALALIVVVMTLPGATRGLGAYLVPDVSRLSGQLVLDAMGQDFFSLSIGVGEVATASPWPTL